MGDYITEEGLKELEELGFKAEDWSAVKLLLDRSNIEKIPAKGGVYVVLRPYFRSPEFKIWQYGDCYEKKEKSHPLMYDFDKLESSWIPETAILYIGKGNNLNERIKTYISYYNKLIECQDKKSRFNNVPHRGGRSIWQIKDAESLIIAWMTTPGYTPGDVESKMIKYFRSKHNEKRPFANKRDERLSKPN